MSQTDPFAPTPGPMSPTGQPDTPAAPYPGGQPGAPTPFYGVGVQPVTQPAIPTPPVMPEQPAPPEAPYLAGQPYAPAQPAMPGQTPYGTPGQSYMSGQPYAAPAQPYGATGQPPPPPAKKKTWLIVLVGVLVIVLAVFGVYWFALRDKGGSGTGGGETPTPSGPTATPDEAVQGYLKALAAGDAAAALAFAATPPTNTTFLTDAVLAASLAIAPITNITVTPSDTPSPAEAHIAASYNIGATGVSTQYDVKLIGDEYLITTITQQVNLISVYIDGLGMALNGVSLSGLQLGSVDLFPGTYQFTLTNSMLVLSPDQFTVKDVSSFTAINANPKLADDAQARLATAVQTALNNCLAEKAMVTSCGFGVGGLQGGATPNTNSIVWRITSGSSDFSQVSFAQYSQQYTEAGAPVDIKVQCTMRDTKGNQYRSNSIPLTAVLVDFTDPDNMQVTFHS